MPYFIIVETTGAPVEVWLNDCAVALFDPAEEGGPGRGMATLEGYVLPGVNTLRLIVDPGPTPSRMLEPHPPVAANAKGEVRVFCPATWDFDPDMEPVVARLTWDDRPAVTAPRTAQAEFAAQGARELPLWWRAVPRQPDAALLDLMVRVQTALEQGDIPALVALQRLPLEASRLAYERSLDQQERLLAEFLADILPDKPVMARLARSEWDLRTFSDGRLIDLIARDWKPIVRRGLPDRLSAIELRVGVIDGLWQVLL